MYFRGHEIRQREFFLLAAGMNEWETVCIKTCSFAFYKLPLLTQHLKLGARRKVIELFSFFSLCRASSYIEKISLYKYRLSIKNESFTGKDNMLYSVYHQCV